MNSKPTALLIVGILWSAYSLVMAVLAWRMATFSVPIDKLPIARLIAPYTLPLIFVVPFLFPKKAVVIVSLIVGVYPFCHLIRHEWVLGGSGWGFGAIGVSIALIGFSIRMIQKPGQVSGSNEE